MTAEGALPDDATALARQECRAVRRLVRLFRCERTGRLVRLPPATAARLIERRGTVIAQVVRLEARRRSFAPWTTGELDLAMNALASEVDRAEEHCVARLAELRVELAQRHGAGVATGLRDGAAGRLLGRG